MIVDLNEKEISLAKTILENTVSEYKLVKFSVKGLTSKSIREVYKLLKDFTNNVEFDINGDLVATVDAADVDVVVQGICNLNSVFEDRIIVEEDKSVQIYDD